MSTASIPPAHDECYRCGYDLRGIENSSPCPECGLLAERSRRQTDELHNTRPRWLRRISWGACLILLSIPVLVAGQLCYVAILNHLDQISAGSFVLWELVPLAGPDLGVVVFWIGALLLTAPEGYPPADHADARRRRMIRWTAFMPLLALAVYQCQLLIFPARPAVIVTLAILLVAGPPLPLLIFLHLRALAKRARSAHLAEHCLIVGIGASLSLVFIAAGIFVFYKANEWFGNYWATRSETAPPLLLAMATTASLFILWSLYLLIRFAIAFSIARRQLRRKWKRDDRSLAPA